MTQGPKVRDVHRIAGLAAAWGQFVNGQTGLPLRRQEIIRASVGYPVVWQWCCYFDGMATGALGAPVTIRVQPGLGRGGSVDGQIFSIQPGPGTYLASGPVGGTPATELIIEVECATAATAPYRICASCAPIFWVPQWGPQG